MERYLLQIILNAQITANKYLPSYKEKQHWDNKISLGSQKFIYFSYLLFKIESYSHVVFWEGDSVIWLRTLTFG